MDQIITEILTYASAHQLEAIGAIAGLSCVWMLMRQVIWTWPLGVTYAVISVYLFVDARLYGQVLLHLYFVVMNLYGWYHWIFGREAGEERLLVSMTSMKVMGVVLGLSTIGVIVLATLFDAFTDAYLPYLDMSITVLSVGAMWLTARKKLESWVFWLVIDVAYLGIFYLTKNYFYLLLYLGYIPMAVEGFFLWRRDLVLTPAPTH